MPTASFTQLDVWKKARLLTRAIYNLTEHFPSHQQYRLTDQMQRAALSIGSNIAEGYGRLRPRDKAHFYTISKGSAEELQHFLIISKDLGYLHDDAEIVTLVDDVAPMLRRLIQRTLEWCGRERG